MKNIFYDKSKIDYGNLLFPRACAVDAADSLNY